jgi:predicted dehydrogenase
MLSDSLTLTKSTDDKNRDESVIRFGVIGYGYWGPNVARNLAQLDGSQVLAISDKTANARKRAQKAYPGVPVVEDAAEIIASPDIDAVAVVTPVWTHYELAKAALENGKHVFVEKPFTSNAAQAEELIELAARKNLKIMVDHTFLFTGAVKKIRQFVEDGSLGKLYYYDSTRVNLGLFQHDVNVIWDLAPHDLSIMDHLIKGSPEAIVATGQTHLNGLEDIAFITVYYPNQVIAHINVNWLSPVKVRTTLIGGEKKMLVWNDLEADEKIKVYDKGVNVTSQTGLYKLLVNYRSGDMWSPQLEQVEALRDELAYFVDCIVKDQDPVNDGHAGLRVVRMLEAAGESLKQRGALVYL